MAEYKKLFNVVIAHTFYTDEISHDFDIVPTPETAALLKQNQLLFRSDNSGFRVLYRTNPPGNAPLIPFGGFNLVFSLRLKNLNGFQIFTDLTEIIPGPDKEFKAGCLAGFSNTNQTGNNLDYYIIDSLRPSSFTYSFPQTGGVPTDIGQLVIKNESGTDVTPTYPNPNTIPADSNGKIYYPVDLSTLHAGLYTFKTTVNNVVASEITEKIYIDGSLIRNPIFGLIKIKVVDWDDFPANRLYRAQFVRRQAKWRYKMVLKTTDISISDDLSIVDGLAVYTFEKKPNETTNGLPTVVFDSITKIPFTQSPRKQFRFIKNPGTIVIMDNLSNPPNNLVSSQGNDQSKSVIYITV